MPERNPVPSVAFKCMHAPECEKRFATLDALNAHLDSTTHECCQVYPAKPAKASGTEADRG